MYILVLALESLAGGRLEWMISGFAMLYATFANWLSLVLVCFYFPLTWKKRKTVTNLLGMLGGLICAVYYFFLRFLTDAITEEIVERHFQGIEQIACPLSAILAAAALAGFVLCGRNLILRRAFSRAARLAVSLPLFFVCAVMLSMQIYALATGGLARLSILGLPELILAMVLAVTLGAKKSSQDTVISGGEAA